MSDPKLIDVSPFTDMEDRRLLEKALDARTHHPELVAMGRGDLVGWVEHVMAPPAFVDCALDGVDKFEDQPAVINYERLVHNRRDVDAVRVAEVVHHLLHQHNVDPAVALVAELAPGPWARTLDDAEVPLDHRLRRASWYVVEGNHRAVAQHLLGIGVFARVSAEPVRTRLIPQSTSVKLRS